MVLSITKTFDTITPQLNSMIRAMGMGGRNRLLNVIATEFIRETRTNFGGGDSSYREKDWRPYSKSYAKVKKKSQPDLVKTGALRDSITKTSPIGNWISVYTKNPYAGYHIFGTKKMPARNYWPIQFSSPTFSRPVFKAEKDLLFLIGKQMNIMSAGALPRLSVSNIIRSSFTFGNIFSPSN